jgi:tetratricopeptide (TPR) repeat protein
MPSEVDHIQRATSELINQRLYDEAILYLDEMENQDSGIKPLVEYLRGQVFIAMRDFTQARKHYELSFKNEFRVRSAEMIATLLLAEGRLESSIDFLEYTIAEETENIRLLKYDLCKFYVISDQYRNAERLMGEILPGLAPPLPPGIAEDAYTLHSAVLSEYENLDDFPNLKAFLSLIEGPTPPVEDAGEGGDEEKGAEGQDVSSP